MKHAYVLSPSYLGKVIRLSVRLYFAPLVGACRGAWQETQRARADLEGWIVDQDISRKIDRNGGDPAHPSPRRPSRS